MSMLPSNGVTLVLAIPAATAALLALLPSYRLSAQLNVLSAFLTLLAALSLFIWKPEPGPYILVDDLNIVFVVLNNFVSFTTRVFSASYIAHELETWSASGSRWRCLERSSSTWPPLRSSAKVLTVCFGRY